MSNTHEVQKDLVCMKTSAYHELMTELEGLRTRVVELGEQNRKNAATFDELSSGYLVRVPDPKKDIVFRFGSPLVANHFALWLCESGEQQYWEWMTYREQEDEGMGCDITATIFHYHGEPGPDGHGTLDEFMGDGIIRTTVSRLDKP